MAAYDEGALRVGDAVEELELVLYAGIYGDRSLVERADVFRLPAGALQAEGAFFGESGRELEMRVANARAVGGVLDQREPYGARHVVPCVARGSIFAACGGCLVPVGERECGELVVLIFRLGGHVLRVVHRQVDAVVLFARFGLVLGAEHGKGVRELRVRLVEDFVRSCVERVAHAGELHGQRFDGEPCDAVPLSQVRPYERAVLVQLAKVVVVGAGRIVEEGVGVAALKVYEERVALGSLFIVELVRVFAQGRIIEELLYGGIFPDFVRQAELVVRLREVVAHIPRGGRLLFRVFSGLDVGREVGHHLIQNVGVLVRAIPRLARQEPDGAALHYEYHAERVLHVLDELAERPVWEHLRDDRCAARVGDDEAARDVCAAFSFEK